jgi:hypothetical protein
VVRTLRSTSHAAARQLAQHGGDGTLRAGSAMPRPADRASEAAQAGGGRLGTPTESGAGESRLAVHHCRRSYQTETALPEARAGQLRWVSRLGTHDELGDLRFRFWIQRRFVLQLARYLHQVAPLELDAGLLGKLAADVDVDKRGIDFLAAPNSSTSTTRL